MSNRTETFTERKTFVYGAEHAIAAPVFKGEYEFTSINLNDADTYRVELDDQQWLAHFFKWHGGHALFYVPKRHNYIAVWQNELRQRVKRIKA